jgi:protein phosphatase
MRYTLKVAAIFECGQRVDEAGNPHQEDCTFPLVSDLTDSARVFVLCDGMGGHDAGEVASATVCTAIGNYFLKDTNDSNQICSDKDLSKAIDCAYDALDKVDNGAVKKMGTTMTLLKFHALGATIAHIGDSRVYHIRPGENGNSTRILFATQDHSLVNDLVRVGELTPQEARRSNQRNIITRAMQPNMKPRPKADFYHTSDIKTGDYFYMCSDGMLEQDEIDDGSALRNIFSHQVASIESKVEVLRSVTSGNRDNHTALVVWVKEVEGASSMRRNLNLTTRIHAIFKRLFCKRPIIEKTTE